MLTNPELTALLEEGRLSWSGPVRRDSLLLRLGSPLQPMVSEVGGPIDLFDQPSIDSLYEPPIIDWTTFVLHQRRLVLCQVLDSLRLGQGLGGYIAALSHIARVGLMTHLNSPMIMSGWDGHLTLELYNMGTAPLLLHYGMPVGKALIYRLHGPPGSANPNPFYGLGPHLGSRYADEFGPPDATEA